MINLSFHLENIFSCWTHMTPFLMQVSEPRMLMLGPGEREGGSVLSDLCTAGPPGAWTRRREKSSSVKARAPSPACECEGSLWSVLRSAEAGPPVSLGTGARRGERGGAGRAD